MSNALSSATQPASRAASAAGAALSGPLLGLVAGGICVLVPWACLRLIRPRKLLLRRVPGRPNHVSVVHVMAVFLMYFASVRVALAAAHGIELKPDIDPPLTVALPANMFGQVVLIAASIALAAMTFRHGLRRGLGLSGRHWAWDTGRAVVGYFAVLPLVVGAWLLTRRLLQAVRPEWVIDHPMLVSVATATAAWKVAIILSVVVLAAVAEELFYRGLLQSMLKRYFGGRAWPAVVATSVLFAASHSNQPAAIPGLFILSAGMGYNYERTGRLVSPILIHAIFNASMIWVRLVG